MKVISYLCTHCGRKFDGEEKDLVECPGCYWSTSVKRTSELDPPAPAPLSSGHSFQSLPPRKSSLTYTFKTIFKILGWILLVFIMIGILFLGWRWLQSKQTKMGHIRTDELLEDEKRRPLKGETSQILTDEEKKILFQSFEFSENDLLIPDIIQILNEHVEIETGFVERLPSRTWTLDQFKQMLAEQERAYQISLPRSYHKKLQAIFTEKYLKAEEAFNQGLLLQARDLWIESLVFPVYADNLQKHRAVALTMLKPLVNDTLAKIGALNSSLTEKGVREREEKVQGLYREVLRLIQDRSWQAALSQISIIEDQMKAFDDPKNLELSPPSYPTSINSVDADIRAALFDIFQISVSSVANFEPLKADLLKKKVLLQGLEPARIEQGRTHYEQGMEFIRRSDWGHASDEFSQVDAPELLVKDAQRKIKILDKILKSSS